MMRKENERFTKKFRNSDHVANATVEQIKQDLHLDELATKRDIRETELRIITQLSTMQQDIQVTKLTNRALLAVGTVIAGALIKLAFF
ncbi:MAG: hypothetical protein WBI40_03770 [Methylococcaceae bacterium]